MRRLFSGFPVQYPAQYCIEALSLTHIRLRQPFEYFEHGGVFDFFVLVLQLLLDILGRTSRGVMSCHH